MNRRALDSPYLVEHRLPMSRTRILAMPATDLIGSIERLLEAWVSSGRGLAKGSAAPALT